MSGKKRLVVLGTATFLLGVILLFPARVAYHAFAPDTFRLAGISGTIWNGSATEGEASGIYLRNIDWSFRPAMLLTGKLAFDTRFDPAGGFMQAGVAAGLGGALTLTDVEGALSIAALQSAMPAPGIDGNVRLLFSRINIENGLPTAADGSIDVVGLVARGLAPMPIGDFRAELTSGDDGITGSVEDTAGMLDIAGVLRLTPDRSYSLTGLVAPTASTPETVINQLRFLGSANQRGQREFRFEGQL